MNRNLTLKLGAIALLILLLLIPLLMINGVIQDRQQLRDGCSKTLRAAPATASG